MHFYLSLLLHCSCICKCICICLCFCISICICICVCKCICAILPKCFVLVCWVRFAPLRYRVMIRIWVEPTIVIIINVATSSSAFSSSLSSTVFQSMIRIWVTAAYQPLSGFLMIFSLQNDQNLAGV